MIGACVALCFVLVTSRVDIVGSSQDVGFVIWECMHILRL